MALIVPLRFFSGSGKGMSYVHCLRFMLMPSGSSTLKSEKSSGFWMLWIWNKATEPEDYTECLSFPVSKSCHVIGWVQGINTQHMLAQSKITRLQLKLQTYYNEMKWWPMTDLKGTVPPNPKYLISLLPVALSIHPAVLMWDAKVGRYRQSGFSSYVSSQNSLNYFSR